MNQLLHMSWWQWSTTLFTLSKRCWDPRFHAVWGVLWGDWSGGRWNFPVRTCEDFQHVTELHWHETWRESHGLELLYQPNSIVFVFSLRSWKVPLLATSSETISRQAMKIRMALIATGVLVESYRAAATAQTEASGWRGFPFYLQWSIDSCYESCFRPSLGLVLGCIGQLVFFRGHPPCQIPCIIIASISSCFHWFSLPLLGFLWGLYLGGCPAFKLLWIIGSFGGRSGWSSLAGSAAQRRTALSRQAGRGRKISVPHFQSCLQAPFRQESLKSGDTNLTIGVPKVLCASLSCFGRMFVILQFCTWHFFAFYIVLHRHDVSSQFLFVLPQDSMKRDARFPDKNASLVTCVCLSGMCRVCPHILKHPRIASLQKATFFPFIWSNYSNLTRPHPPKNSWGREIPLFQGNQGWWNILASFHELHREFYKFSKRIRHSWKSLTMQRALGA